MGLCEDTGTSFQDHCESKMWCRDHIPPYKESCWQAIASEIRRRHLKKKVFCNSHVSGPSSLPIMISNLSMICLTHMPGKIAALCRVISFSFKFQHEVPGCKQQYWVLWLIPLESYFYDCSWNYILKLLVHVLKSLSQLSAEPSQRYGSSLWGYNLSQALGTVTTLPHLGKRLQVSAV